jgi:hypothetical protein
MARKLTGGLVGSSTLLGTIQISPDSALATAADQNITFSPGGTGIVVSTANVQLNAQTDLRFADSDSSNWVAFQAPATVAANVTWTLPAVDGSTGQFLSTNSSGTLSWASGSLSLTDQTASATTHYPLITTATSGTVTAANTSSTKFSFQPSTGTITATIFSGSASATATTLTTTNSTFYPTFVSSNTSTTNQAHQVATAFTFNASNGTLTSTIVTASSDARLKENIITIDDALNKTLALRGVMFNRIGSLSKELGVIAQEVEEIVPELVVTGEDGFKSVAYGNTVGLLIESIKTLNDKIEELKGRLS